MSVRASSWSSRIPAICLRKIYTARLEAMSIMSNQTTLIRLYRASPAEGTLLARVARQFVLESK